MASVPLRAPVRVSFDAPLPEAFTDPSLSLDCSLETQNTLSDALEIKHFISEFSTLPKLRSCGTVYLKQHHKWNRCDHALCPSCSRQRANGRAAILHDLSADYAEIMTLTLSLASTPAAPLVDLWDDLDALRSRWVGSHWLRSQIDGWRWSMELTRTVNGWHPHLVFVLFSRNTLSPADYDRLQTDSASRWATMATQLGHYAEADVQILAKVTRTSGRALRYATKGMIASPEHSVTPGSIVRRAATGDADAADLWAEIEAASVGRRFQGTGGTLRKARS
ncbi:hypothetical protein [Microbacterium sp. 16-032]|uniref:hypothetical protein n=1 Tax=Microbacterium sp. 16-032 TaxID=3239808 RepID=UPI0034E241AC